MIGCRLIGLEAGVWSRMGQIRAKRRPWSRAPAIKSACIGRDPLARGASPDDGLGASSANVRGYLQVAIRSARSPEAVVSFARMTQPSSMAIRHI